MSCIMGSYMCLQHQSGVRSSRLLPLELEDVYHVLVVTRGCPLVSQIGFAYLTLEIAVLSVPPLRHFLPLLKQFV
jgi:hypothetical protein